MPRSLGDCDPLTEPPQWRAEDELTQDAPLIRGLRLSTVQCSKQPADALTQDAPLIRGLRRGQSPLIDKEFPCH